MYVSIYHNARAISDLDTNSTWAPEPQLSSTDCQTDNERTVICNPANFNLCQNYGSINARYIYSRCKLQQFIDPIIPRGGGVLNKIPLNYPDLDFIQW